MHIDKNQVELEEKLILIHVRMWTSWALSDLERIRILPLGDSRVYKETLRDCLIQLERIVTKQIELAQRIRGLEK